MLFVCNEIYAILGMQFFISKYFVKTGKMSIYKAFVRPHLNCGDVNYDKALQPNISSET